MKCWDRFVLHLPGLLRSLTQYKSINEQSDILTGILPSMHNCVSESTKLRILAISEEFYACLAKGFTTHRLMVCTIKVPQSLIFRVSFCQYQWALLT